MQMFAMPGRGWPTHNFFKNYVPGAHSHGESLYWQDTKRPPRACRCRMTSRPSSVVAERDIVQGDDLDAAGKLSLAVLSFHR
jgi:hypothetical protein